MTGEIRDCTAFRQHAAVTGLPLVLEPNGSTFVVFRRPIGPAVQGTTRSNYPVAKERKVIEGPWTVSFDPKWGGPESIVFDNLSDWTTHPPPGIRYYSGRAAYTKSFVLGMGPDETEARRFLTLGDVREMARIRLNGKDRGVVWAPPYRVEISGVVHPGENQLEIDVINTWRNRLAGDRDLPLERRFTRTNVRVTKDWKPIGSICSPPIAARLPRARRSRTLSRADHPTASGRFFSPTSQRPA